MAIGVGDQLIGALGRGVERDRGVDPVIDARRLLGVAAIDRGRAGINERCHSRQAAYRLEHDDLPHHVRLDIGVGILQRMADAGLGREMDDAIDLGVASDDRGDRRTVGMTAQDFVRRLLRQDALRPDVLRPESA